MTGLTGLTVWGETVKKVKTVRTKNYIPPWKESRHEFFRSKPLGIHEWLVGIARVFNYFASFWYILNNSATHSDSVILVEKP